jgi:hypothetical protein
MVLLIVLIVCTMVKAKAILSKTWLVLVFVSCSWLESQQTEGQHIPEIARDNKNKPKVKRKIAGQDCNGEWNTLGEYVTPECKSAHRSFPTLQSGIFLVGPSLYSPLKIITHSFRKSFR